MLIDDPDVVVRVQDLPIGVKGFVVDSPDGTHNIYLNARYTYKAMLETYLHELEHIRRDDLASDDSLEEIEGRLRR